jgi:hypothetical protein
MKGFLDGGIAHTKQLMRIADNLERIANALETLTNVVAELPMRSEQVREQYDKQ